MLQLPNRLPEIDKLDPEDRMFVHSSRPDWGVGLWVKEEQSRRRMRFEDGEQRAFKKGFYHLLEPVDPDRDDLDDVFEALADEHEQVLAERAQTQARVDKPPLMSFAEQLQVFRALYEGGFGGEPYQDAARTRPSGKLCKRHVDEELRMAGQLLSKEAMQAHLTTEDHDAVVDAARRILARTTLVKPSRGRKLLDAMDDPEDRKTFALALYRLLHGKKRYRKRFKAWVKALRSSLHVEPGWSLATVFPALVFPDDHVCVKRRPVALQAREISPGAHIPKQVNRRGYRRARRVARKTRKLLVAEGLAPVDLLDVHRFMWDTLRPKSRALLDDLGTEV